MTLAKVVGEISVRQSPPNSKMLRSKSFDFKQIHHPKKRKVIVVMPAYNAEKTLEKTYRKIPKDIVDDVILVDDGSLDKTLKVANQLRIKTFKRPQNRGYGGNQKTCYIQALKQGATHIIMLHPDGQYDAEDLPLFVNSLKNKDRHLILGSRFLGKHHQTPFYKAISILFLTFLFNLVLRTRLTELNTGYRGFSRKFLETVPFRKNGDGYIFDPQIIIQAVYFGFRISEVPVAKDYLKEASSPNFYQSVRHGLENLQLLARYILHILKIKRADFLTIPQKIEKNDNEIR